MRRNQKSEVRGQRLGSVLCFVFLFVFAFSFVDATQAEVVIVDDVGSFSGAVLRVVSPVTGNVGDKIYASEYLTQAGVIKFDIETALSEVSLSVVISKNGMIVDRIEEGPFVMDGSRILIDRRDGINRSGEEVVVENESVVKENETVAEENESLVVDVSGDGESLRKRLTGMFLTGKAVFIEDDGSVNFGVSAGTIISMLMLVVFFVFIAVRRNKGECRDSLSDDDKELKYMEKKVRDTEKRIASIKSERGKKAKVESVRAKLAKEERELRELEKEDRKNSERVEDI